MDDLLRARMQRHARQLRQDVEDEVERAEGEHPLDTLLRTMESHGWNADDPMVSLVREAQRIPYPMPRWEARERGLL